MTRKIILSFYFIATSCFAMEQKQSFLELLKSAEALSEQIKINKNNLQLKLQFCDLIHTHSDEDKNKEQTLQLQKNTKQFIETWQQVGDCIENGKAIIDEPLSARIEKIVQFMKDNNIILG